MSDQPYDLRTAIGAVMGQVLVRGPLAEDEDFFDCGGDSLRAIEVLQRLVEEYGAGTVDADADEELRATLLEAIFSDATPGGLATVWVAHTTLGSPAQSRPGGV